MPHFAALLAVLAFVAFPRLASAAELRFEPGVAYLGSFSTLDPLDSDVSRDGISVELQSDADWRLEVRMTSPPHRTADGLALAPNRAPGSRSSSRPPGFSLEPQILMFGQGANRSGEVRRDWRGLARALEDYLDRGDPPGSYEVTLAGRLLDAAGGPLTDYTSLSIRFDVVPWVQIVDRRIPDFAVMVLDGALEGVSPSQTVRLVSNSSWSLLVSGGQEVEARAPKCVVHPGELSACAQADGQTRWRPFGPGYVPLGQEPQSLVVGDAPEPFSVADEIVPIVIRFHTENFIPAGRYGAALCFTARVGQPSP